MAGERDVLAEEFREAYESALSWAEKQELWVAEKLPNEGIYAAISGNIAEHFRRFLVAAPPEPLPREALASVSDDDLLLSINDARRLIVLVKAEYQRFYDFVGESDPALVDAWHFTENARRLSPDRPTPP